jgi:GNAT superfamily N-acetyltransferase
MNIVVRPLTKADHDAWLPLWKGYQAFYKADIPDKVSAVTWARFHDADEPMFALGAFDGDVLLGITHYLFHRTCWAVGNTCYLQDLFTVDAARGKGVGRALIEAVYAAAALEGCQRVYWQTHETNAVAQVLYNDIADRSGFIVYRKPIQ